MKKVFLLCFATILITNVYSQVSINDNGSLPDTSAMLDIASFCKGLLIPRIGLTDTADATTIPGAQTSLLIYNTTVNAQLVEAYYYNAGTPAAPHWVQLIPNPMNTNINMSNNKIINLATCTDDHDAVNKAYVDALIAGVGGGGGGSSWPTMISDESPSTVNYYRGAHDYCKYLTEGGYTDWYVPTIEELWVAFATTTYPVPDSLSPNYFWTRYQGGNNIFYCTRLDNGGTSSGNPTSTGYYARCVR